MQFNWTVCVPLKYLILIPDIQEAKCFEFTVQICPPPKKKTILIVIFLRHYKKSFKNLSIKFE